MCNYRFGGVSFCPEPSLPETEGLCIFHSRREDKEAQAFRQAFEEKVKRKDFSFQGYYFPESLGRIDFSEFAREISNADFKDSEFHCSAIFNGVKFTGGKASFDRAKFLGEEASFQGVEFLSDKTVFHETSFSSKKMTSFESAEFYGRLVSFHMTQFSSSRTSFERAVFSSEATDFKDTAFEDFCTFREAKFPKVATKSVVFKNVNLSNCRFLEANIDAVQFSDSSFKRIKKNRVLYVLPDAREVLADELDIDEEVKKAPEKRRKYEQVGMLYRQLKSNFEGRKNMQRASEAAYGGMECKRKAMSNRLMRNFGPLVLYRLFGGYGERPFRIVLLVGFLILVLCPLVYKFTGGVPTASRFAVIGIHKVDDSFYGCVVYSVKVACLQYMGTLRQPRSAVAKQLFTAESLLAPVLATYVGWLFKKKFAL